MFKFQANSAISWFGLGLLQILFLSIAPTLPAEAQAPCSSERLRRLSESLRNQSPPSRESREIRSDRHRFKFQVPANYRAVTSRGGILILSPEAYDFHQCQPRITPWYFAAKIYITDSSLPSSASLQRVFDMRSLYQPEGIVQQVSIAGEPALRYHDREGGDGLTRRYFLRSPSRTKTITISSWVNSVNDPEPEILSRIIESFELLYSSTENSLGIGIVPTLDVCGLAVWQDPDDELTHILTASGGDSSATLRINGRILQLRSTGSEITLGQTSTPSSFTFQNSDRSIVTTLQGDW